MEKRHQRGGRGGHRGGRGNQGRGKPGPSNEQGPSKHISPYKKSGDKHFQQQQKFGAKKRKFVLDFNEDDRNSFLTGFQKRKQERRARAKKEIEEKVKKEVERIRAEKKEKIKEMCDEVNVAPILDEDNAEYTMNYDLEEQTVSITGYDMGRITDSLGTTIGSRKVQQKDDDDDNDEEEEVQEDSDKDNENSDKNDDDEEEEQEAEKDKKNKKQKSDKKLSGIQRKKKIMKNFKKQTNRIIRRRK